MALVDTLLAAGVLELIDHNPISPGALSIAVRRALPAVEPQQNLRRGLGSLVKAVALTLRPPVPPSLLWKAYAQTLWPYLSLNSDLSAVRQAVFVASPLQLGVPANDLVPEGVTNYQQYLKADCMQKKDMPLYSLENGSYFAQLWAYLRNVQLGPSNRQLEETRGQLTTAKAAKDETFDQTLYQYQELALDERKVPFIDWVKQHGSGYSQSWNAEDRLEKKYESLQDEAIDDVLRALATMKSADSRIDFKLQSNMPCIVTDANYYTTTNPNLRQPPSSDLGPLYYRPYHMLSGYRTKAQSWLSRYDPQDHSANRTEIPFDFDTARTLNWARLGHDGLKDDPAPASADDIYSSISTKLSFIGLQAFDVDRGLWDVKKPRDLRLGPQAPKDLEQPFWKTTKLLLGYGVDLIITLPVTTTAADKLKQNKFVSLLGIPLTEWDVRKNELHVSLGDNAYPVLLGVLAQEV